MPFTDRLAAYRQPITYNLAVAREIVKLVYRAEGLSPPTSVDTIRTAYQTIWSRASSREYWQNAIKSGEIAKLAIYGLEAYGIFKVSIKSSGTLGLELTSFVRLEKSLVVAVLSDTMCTRESLIYKMH